MNIDIEDVPVFSQLREQKIFGTGTIAHTQAATTKISLQNIPIFIVQFNFLYYSPSTKWLKLELGVLRGFGLRSVAKINFSGRCFSDQRKCRKCTTNAFMQVRHGYFYIFLANNILIVLKRCC